MNTGNVKGSSMSTASWKSGDTVPDQFPAGLRVLVVDDDPTCLIIVERMLKRCHYEVTTCNRAEKALASLKANRNGFDIVISDVHMPDMDGFKLLELIGLDMDLPVIMMSADDGKSVVMKGVTHGACDYLIKPIRIEELKNIWQHVIRKRKGGMKEMEQSASVDDGDSRLNNNKQQQPYEHPDYTSSATEASWKNSKRRKDEEEDELDDASGLKKPRVVWSIELHQQFVAAVNQLGIDKAVPKKILELMNVPGLSRENVASHLQKYRLYLRRLSGVSQHHHGSFINPQDPTFGPMSSFSGLHLQTLAVVGQLQPQSLATLQAAAAGFGRPSPKSTVTVPMVDQRNIFSFDNSHLKFVDPDRHISTKPMNLLHGIPTAMSAQSFENNTMQKGINLLMPQMVERQSQTKSRAPQANGSRFPMNHHETELQGNNFPVLINPNLASKARYEEDVCSSKGLTGELMSGCNETQQICSKELEFHTVDAYLNHNDSSYQDLSSSRHRGGGSVGNNKIKSDVVRDRIGLFQQQFGQEDLMSVFLKQQGGVGSVSNEFDFDGYAIDNIPV